MSQEGKVAIITGSAQGIGKALAENLLEQKAKVMLSDIDATLGEETCKELALKYGDAVKFVKCDVTSDSEFEDAIKQTIKVFGSLDLLINNAGIMNELNLAWKKTIAVNFISMVRGTYLGMKYMDKHKGAKGGTIVNVSSKSAYVRFASIPVYSATKAAITHFCRCIGEKQHYDRTGVKIVCIHPHGVITHMQDSFLKNTFDCRQPTNDDLQSPDTVGKGLIKILEVAESGSTWEIEKYLPPKQIRFTVEVLEG